jgi:hypothetical protein
MLPNRTAIALCALSLCALAPPSAADAALVTYFSFDTYDGNATTISPADLGTGSLTLAGWDSDKLGVAAGSDATAESPPPMTGNKAISLGKLPSSTPATITINDVSTLGSADMQLSFETKSSNGTYQSVEVQYSLNGGALVDIETEVLDPSDPNRWKTNVISLDQILAINNHPNVSVQLFFTGGSAGGGSDLLLDNLKIQAMSAVPEPHSLAMAAMALLFAGLHWWRGRSAVVGQVSHIVR